ncbi:MAG: PP0621 family protein [Gammaproteobacteria bacterium]|nr:PP0621 family protein [Gammaproteobacteria bacterium]MDH5651482.1 PP0621 family protein [Gammaproteobacteria bacterium]
MTLIRILIIAFLVWLVLRLIKNKIDQQNRKRADSQDQIATMVRCRHCGLHIPKQDAVESANQYYCSQEHRRLAEKND